MSRDDWFKILGAMVVIENHLKQSTGMSELEYSAIELVKEYAKKGIKSGQ